MGQVSYGTITITDTNDIESITVEYARNQDPANAPDTGWDTTRPNWEQDYYIWQRTRIHKSGTSTYSDTFGAAVCLTGSTGSTGASGRSLTNTIIQYTTAASSATITEDNMGNYTWSDNVPSYSSNTPAYWVRTTNTYSNPAGTQYIIYKDNGLTDAISTSVAANTTANAANQTANAAFNNTQAKYATSSTLATSTAKIATFSPTITGWSLFSGAEIFVRFTNKNTIASPTLNVNQTGAKPIKDSDGNDLAEQFYWKDNSLVHFVYDGTNWRILDIVTTEKYNKLVSDIDGVSQTVGTKASQTDLTNLTTRVSTNETNISQTATSITSLVSNQDTYTAPDGTTKTNTIKSAIKQNADNIDLKVSKDGVIASINASVETSGGSAVKISADKVNIEGAAIFTSGRLSTTNLNNTIDGRIPEIPDDISDLSDSTGIIPDVSGLASKTDAVYRTQRIYYRKTSSGAPNKNTTWLVSSGTGYGNWSLNIPQLTHTENNEDVKYSYLYTAVQIQTISQYNSGVTANNCSCSDVLLDDSTTVIDGGAIIAGSVTANEITGNTLSAIYADMGAITAGSISRGNNSINFNQDAATLEFKNSSNWTNATRGIQWTGSDLNIKGNITATSLTIGSGATVSGLSTFNISGINNYATITAAQGYANDASYSVEIEVRNVVYTTPTATLFAHVYYKGGELTSSTNPAISSISFQWKKVVENSGTYSVIDISGATSQSLVTSDLDTTYICVISNNS